MKQWIVRFSRLPIKWKLTLWSALLLFLIFAVYNSVQYLFINQWMLKQEENHTRQTMREIQSYFAEKKSSLNETEIEQSRIFLEKSNEPNQLIRVLDGNGIPIIVVSQDIPAKWVAPKPAEKTEIERVWHEKDHLLVMRSPLQVAQFQGTVEIINNMENLDKLNEVIFVMMIAGGVVAIGLSGLGGRLLAGQLLRPIHSMAETMRKIKQKGLHERVQLEDNKDEISTLMIMFNEMMDQVESSFQQQKQFVEDASHELRTPVAIIEGHLALLKRWGKRDPAVLEESLTASLQELTRLKGLVQELLALTRAEKVNPGGASHAMDNLDQAIRLIIRNVAVLHPAFHFDIETDSLSNVAIAVDPQHLEQVMLIVLDNAVKYSLDSKTIRIIGYVRGGEACIEMIDFGIGIPENELPYVMDRFYRVDKARSRELGGHGLGLSIAKRLMERYHGTIVIRSTENKGTSVVIAFPVASMERK